MDSTQKIQEYQYETPYHWFMQADEYRGRKYFGYTSLCISMAEKYGFDVKNNRILDAGCGDARFVKILLDRGAKNVEGLDYSDKALAFARVFLPQINFFVGDLTVFKTLEKNGQYDAVFLIETLEHIETKKVDFVIQNLTKLLKKGGLLVITVPSVRLPLHEKHYQHFTAKSLNEIVSKHLKICDLVGYAATGHRMMRLVYKLVDNRFWTIKPLTKIYNLRIYPKYLLQVHKDTGEGLLVVAKNE